MIAFDFLYDPRVALIERIRAWRVSATLTSAAIALLTVVVVVTAAWFIERQKISGALSEAAALRVQYGALRERLVREKLEAGEVADLGALDGDLRDIAASGGRVRDRLASLAAALPLDVWLVSINDDGTRLSLVGRATSLSGVARAMARLAGSRFGTVSLDGVARIERPGHAILEFSAAADGG